MSESKIKELVNDLLKTIDASLNKAWFFAVIEDSPVKPSVITEVVGIFNNESYFSPNLDALAKGCEQLNVVLKEIRQYIIPGLRERLGVSSLTGRKVDKRSDSFIHNSMISYTLPCNVENMERLLGELESFLPPYFPEQNGSVAQKVL